MPSSRCWSPTERPYARLPQIVADSDFVVGPAGLLHYGFDSEVVNFDRDIGVTGWRAGSAPRCDAAFRGPGLLRASRRRL